VTKKDTAGIEAGAVMCHKEKGPARTACVHRGRDWRRVSLPDCPVAML